MRLRRRSAVAGILAATTIIAAAPIGATAAPANPQPAAATPLTGEHLDHDYEFVDNRGAAAAPTAGQRSLVRDDNLVTRWNKLGTPASVTPAKGKLAAGLKGDAEAVARGFLKNSVGLFSLRGAAVDNLETLAQTKVGEGTVVLLRQRFGDLPAGHDGLVAVAVKGGDVLRVTSSLSPRDRRAGRRPPSRRTPALAAALADAGIAARRARRHPGPAGRRADAGRRPAGGLRGRRAVQGRRPPARLHHLRGRPRRQGAGPREPGQLRRGQPALGGLPGHPGRGRHRHPARPGARRPRRAARGGAATRPPARPWDVDLATGTPTFTTQRQLGRHGAAAGATGRPRCPPTPRPDRDYVYPFTNQWNTSKCDPNALTSPAAGRRRRGHREPVRHAQPDARLVATSWASPRRPGTCRRSTSPRTARAATPSRATPSRARPTAGTRNNANQAHPAGRHAADHEHVHVAAVRRRGVPALRRRRLRHDGDRARVHPRDHQPDDRRPGHRHQLAARAARWARAGPTCWRWSTCSRAATRPRGNTPFVTGAYVTGDLSTRHPQLRHEQQPAQLLRTRLRPRRRRCTPTVRSGAPPTSTSARAFIARYGSGTRALQESCAPAGRRRPSARATGAGRSWCSTRSCSGHRRGQHAGHARQHAHRRRAALRRRQRRPAVERVRRARHGRGRGPAGRPTPTRCRASPRRTPTTRR